MRQPLNGARGVAKFLGRGLGLIVALLLGGCSTGWLLVTLRADAETNQGRPMQILVRSVSVDAYRGESYAALARLVIQPDKSVLRALTIEPKDRFTRRLLLTVPSAAPVALYFFYQSQIGSWKMLLPPPLPLAVMVPLGRNGVLVDTVRECRLFP